MQHIKMRSSNNVQKQNLWHNTPVNVPAARTVAERPFPVTRRCRAWQSASSEIGLQVLCLPLQPQFRFQIGAIRGYNTDSNLGPTDCLMPIVRNSPPECVNIPTDCRAAGLILPALPTALQVSQLASVVADRHRVGHDPKKIVNDAQKVVGCYHLILLRAYCLPAWRSQRHAGFARHQARNTTHKPSTSFINILYNLIAKHPVRLKHRNHAVLPCLVAPDLETPYLQCVFNSVSILLNIITLRDLPVQRSSLCRYHNHNTPNFHIDSFSG